MNNDIQLYHADGTPAETIALDFLLRDAVKHILGRPLIKNATIIIKFSPITANSKKLSGLPQLINLAPKYGYATIVIQEGKKIVYQHPHSVDELIAETLQRYLKTQYPEETLWKYKVIIPHEQFEDTPMVGYGPPLVAGTMPIIPYANNEAIPFNIKKIPEPKLPEIRMEDFNLQVGGPGKENFSQVLIHEAVAEKLLHKHHFSSKVEEGGFLIGKVFQQHDEKNRYILEITTILPARYTGASLLHFTYTGDSFAELKRTLREKYPQARLLGWYHTHLFPASFPIGLSSIDWELHFTTFSIPWQIAGLLNIDSPSERTLRFYVRHKNLMVTCPWWIVTE